MGDYGRVGRCTLHENCAHIMVQESYLDTPIEAGEEVHRGDEGEEQLQQPQV